MSFSVTGYRNIEGERIGLEEHRFVEVEFWHESEEEGNLIGGDDELMEPQREVFEVLSVSDTETGDPVGITPDVEEKILDILYGREAEEENDIYDEAD